MADNSINVVLFDVPHRLQQWAFVMSPFFVQIAITLQSARIANTTNKLDGNAIAA
jgi:hypothetical protein